MKCAQCGHDKLTKTTSSYEVGVGEKVVTVFVAATKCGKCGEVYVGGDVIEHAELLVAERIARSGIVSGETFRFLRKALGFAAKDMVNVIGTPPETISRWEKGVRDVDRFAWVTLAMMVLDKAEGRSPGTHDIVKATMKPSVLPKRIKAAS